MAPVVAPHHVRVLLVDDHQDTRDMFTMFLHLCGMNVQGRGCARDALEDLAGSRYDVVVTDLRLGVISGLDLTRAIKRNPATSHLPVILLTGDTRANLEEEAAAAGCAAVCLKPMLPDVLIDVIATVLGTAARPSLRWLPELHHFTPYPAIHPVQSQQGFFSPQAVAT